MTASHWSRATASQPARDAFHEIVVGFQTSLRDNSVGESLRLCSPVIEWMYRSTRANGSLRAGGYPGVLMNCEVTVIDDLQRTKDRNVLLRQCRLETLLGPSKNLGVA